MNPSDQAIFKIERPHPKLRRLYILRALLSGPAVVFTLPLLLLRYQSLRYRFDEEGISMRWGVFFHREITLTYTRIQDIHVHAGVLQRFFGVADLLIQTASGSAGAEIILEGLLEYAAVRDFLYRRMAGAQGAVAASGDGVGRPSLAAASANGGLGGPEAVMLLRQIRDDLAAVRAAVSASSPENQPIRGHARSVEVQVDAEAGSRS